LKEVHLKVGNQTYVNVGKRISEELKTLIGQAEKGTEITVGYVVINGPSGENKIDGPFTRIKTSEKGTNYSHPAADIKCEG
jgi:hypothetical protein